MYHTPAVCGYNQVLRDSTDVNRAVLAGVLQKGAKNAVHIRLEQSCKVPCTHALNSRFVRVIHLSFSSSPTHPVRTLYGTSILETTMKNDCIGFNTLVDHS